MVSDNVCVRDGVSKCEDSVSKDMTHVARNVHGRILLLQEQGVHGRPKEEGILSEHNEV